MVADFLRRKKPEVIAETSNRLEEYAYALIVENGYENYDRFPVLDDAWSTVSPAIPLFLAGNNSRLQTVCTALRYFLDFTGRWDEMLSINQQAEARALSASDLNNAGWRACHVAWIHCLYKQTDALLEWANRAATHWQAVKAGAFERATAMNMLGLGYRLKQDYPAALKALSAMLNLHRSLSIESEDVASALNDLATVERLSGDLAASERDFCEALRVSRAVGFTMGETLATGNLAIIALDREDWPRAELLARKALPLAEKLGRQELIASNCSRIAKALVYQGHNVEALTYARRAVTIYTQLGSPDLAWAQYVLQECEN